MVSSVLAPSLLAWLGRVNFLACCRFPMLYLCLGRVGNFRSDLDMAVCVEGKLNMYGWCLVLRWCLIVLRWCMLVLRWCLVVLRWCLVVLRWPCAVDGTRCLSPVYCNFQTTRHLSGSKVKWKTTDKVLLEYWVKYDGQMHQTKKEIAVIQKSGNVQWICDSQKV